MLADLMKVRTRWIIIVVAGMLIPISAPNGVYVFVLN